jgi:predicted acylesterase/phospholipase RssA
MITHVIFSGGNLNGLSYIGVIRYLITFNLHHNITDCAGTSIGSIFATTLALKIPIEDLEKIFYEYSKDEDTRLVSFKKFKDIFLECGAIDVKHMLTSLYNYVEKMVGNAHISFEEVSKRYGINLHINAFCLNTQKDFVFNIENSPHVNVLDAIRASTAIAFLYKPVYIDGFIYTDGGFVKNIMAEDFSKIPKSQKLLVLCNKQPAQPEPILDKNTQIDFMTFTSIILTNCMNSVFEHSSTKHIDPDTTIVIKNEDIFLESVLTKKGVYQDCSTENIEKAIIYGFQKAYEFFKHRYEVEKERLKFLDGDEKISDSGD